MPHFLRTLIVLVAVLTKAPLATAATIGAAVSSAQKSPTSQVSQACRRDFMHSLSGLYSIDNLDIANLVQPHTEFEPLYALAHDAQTELSELMMEISMISNVSPLIPAVKSADRAQEKIDTELNGETGRITDLARATLVADDIGSVVSAFEQLNRDAEIVRVKNRFKTPAPSGYRDLSVLVRLPRTQMIAEVQLHLRDIADVKSGPEHAAYEEIQRIERQVALETREMNDIEMARVTRLRQQSQDMYQQAWQSYLQPVAQVS
uniref:phosphoribosylglycinamide formyltransferase n=1 Tax=Thaumasiovibrio occultus TaxID=1891184 RepID=UPI000B357D86|nr:phosphoribosylglycinamide formyltransferase [Thaumasiovibrio occultus]